MLTAGGAIVFLATLPSHLIRLFFDYASSNPIGPEGVMVLVGGYLCSRALLIGFTVNLLLRALWLAAYLGVNFVFPTFLETDNLSHGAHVVRAGRLMVDSDTLRSNRVPEYSVLKKLKRWRLSAH